MNRLAPVLLACFVLASCSSEPQAASTTAPPAGSTTASTDSRRVDPTAGVVVSLVQVIDGDTIEVDTGTAIESVRLIGINAPEQDECHGDTARTALEERLHETTITLVSGTQDDRDTFGRLLRYVIADGTDANAQQLRDGHAFVLQTEHDRLEAYAPIAGIAAESGTGLWGTDDCGPSREEPLRIFDFDANPPGPDDDPTSGEYVVVVRWADGPEAWNLAGWVLRDESSIHRYEFPDIDILPTQEYTVRTACGTDRGFELYWCAGGPVWSNRGDTIILQDPAGNVVDHLTYRR